MGGFAAALGGAGQALGQYNQQQRELHQQTKMEMARQVGELIKQYPPDSDEYRQGVKHLNDVLGAQPGKDNTSLFQKVHDWIYPHPKNVQGMAQIYGTDQNQPKTLPPGPALPGNVAGTPQVVPPVNPPATGANMLTAQLPGFTLPGAEGTGVAPLQPPAQKPAPPPPVAAQPSTSPAATPADGGQIKAPAPPPPAALVSADATAPVIPSVVRLPGTPGSVPPVSAADNTGAIPPVTQGAIDDPYGDVPPNLRQYVNSNSVLRQKQIEPYVLQRAQRQEALRLATETARINQQNTLNQRRSDLEFVKEVQAQHPDWPLPLVMSIAVPGAQIGNALQVPHILAPQVDQKDIPEGQLDSGGHEIDRSGATVYRKVQYPGSLTPVYDALPPRLITTQTAGGIQRTPATVAGPVAGAVPPVQNTPIQGQAAGIPAVTSVADSAASIPPLPLAVTPNAQLSSNSISTQPGAPPIATKRTRGSGAGASTGTILPVVPPTSNGGSIPPASSVGPKPVEFNDPLAKANYDNYIAGKGSKLPERQMNGVRLYAESHGLPLPDVSNPAAQKSVSAIDPVIAEINGALDKLNSMKGNPVLAVDYLKYKNGMSTPLNDLFTTLSFESLRSAAAALQGMNSRAYPILNRALAHTPNLDRLGGLNPDSVDLMKDKLNSVKNILNESRAAALQDGSVTGVIPSVGTTGPGRGGLTTPVTADPLGIR